MLKTCLSLCDFSCHLSIRLQLKLVFLPFLRFPSSLCVFSFSLWPLTSTLALFILVSELLVLLFCFLFLILILILIPSCCSSSFGTPLAPFFAYGFSSSSHFFCSPCFASFSSSFVSPPISTSPLPALSPPPSAAAAPALHGRSFLPAQSILPMTRHLFAFSLSLLHPSFPLAVSFPSFSPLKF